MVWLAVRTGCYLNVTHRGTRLHTDRSVAAARHNEAQRGSSVAQRGKRPKCANHFPHCSETGTLRSALRSTPCRTDITTALINMGILLNQVKALRHIVFAGILTSALYFPIWYDSEPLYVLIYLQSLSLDVIFGYPLCFICSDVDSFFIHFLFLVHHSLHCYDTSFLVRS
jgi:hypothetical protein